MSDVEWYLESAGVRKGPFSARQIISMMKSGEVAGDALVTTARMQGDWVTVKDLAEAYSELNPKRSAPVADDMPTSPGMPSPLAPGRDQYQAPPRPVEQLEASKLIVLQQEHEPESDPTESLFSAVQAIREKKQSKFVGPGGVDRTGEATRTSFHLPPQAPLFLGIVLLIGVAVFGALQLMKDDAPVADTPPQTEATTSAPPPTPGGVPVGTAPALSGNRLLSEGGGSDPSSVRRPPPIQKPRVESYRRAPEPEPEERRITRDRDRERERDTRDSEPQPEAPPDLENPADYKDQRDSTDGAPRDENTNAESPEGVAPEELTN